VRASDASPRDLDFLPSYCSHGGLVFSSNVLPPRAFSLFFWPISFLALLPLAIRGPFFFISGLYYTGFFWNGLPTPKMGHPVFSLVALILLLLSRFCRLLFFIVSKVVCLQRPIFFCAPLLRPLSPSYVSMLCHSQGSNRPLLAPHLFSPILFYSRASLPIRMAIGHLSSLPLCFPVIHVC